MGAWQLSQIRRHRARNPAVRIDAQRIVLVIGFFSSISPSVLAPCGATPMGSSVSSFTCSSSGLAGVLTGSGMERFSCGLLQQRLAHSKVPASMPRKSYAARVLTATARPRVPPHSLSKNVRFVSLFHSFEFKL
jgi:hypothetical protein